MIHVEPSRSQCGATLFGVQVRQTGTGASHCATRDDCTPEEPIVPPSSRTVCTHNLLSGLPRAGKDGGYSPHFFLRECKI